MNMRIFGAVALIGLGMALTGCKSAPELSAADAQKLIQAKYDAQPAAGVDIVVNEASLKQGAIASYWTLTKKYPNPLWGDFKLTDTGKKAIKLAGGGDTIQWREESINDPKYSIMVTTVAANHLKAHDLKDVQSDGADGKTVEFTEGVVLDGVPAPLAEIAHNPGNKLSAKRTASFALDGGAWKLASIR
jgi:hypothetical protein